MRVLLTGAGGFTGRHFSECARGAGVDVVPLSADLLDRDAVRTEVLRVQPQAVVHLAAISFVGHADEGELYRVNVVGTTNLLAAAAALPYSLSQVLLASSANVYGNAPVSPITEDALPAPVNHYATSKLAMEMMARTFADRLPVVITRPFNYTGTGQASQFLVPKLVDHFARRASRIELGNLDVEREFNDVRMVCDAYLKLLDKGRPGATYNVCSGQPYSLQQLIQSLEQLTGHRMEVAVNPAFVRANEVHRLCGDPRRLIDTVGPITTKTLDQTLGWMLDAAGA